MSKLSINVANFSVFRNKFTYLLPCNGISFISFLKYLRLERNNKSIVVINRFSVGEVECN